MTNSAQIDEIEGSFRVTVDYHYFFTFRYDEGGLLVEVSSGCDGSHRDELMMRAMRRKALSALEAAGYMKTALVTKGLVSSHQ